MLDPVFLTDYTIIGSTRYNIIPGGWQVRYGIQQRWLIVIVVITTPLLLFGIADRAL